MNRALRRTRDRPKIEVLAGVRIREKDAALDLWTVLHVVLVAWISRVQRLCRFFSRGATEQDQDHAQSANLASEADCLHRTRGAILDPARTRPRLKQLGVDPTTH